MIAFHMTSWAAEIDSQSYNNDVLFIQAAGNISTDVISAYWQAGYPYPEYLDRELCRISNPAQSLQAITVGSVSATELETDDFIALGKQMEVSSFSRSGPGIWDVLKPEVVEYGGTHVYNKGSLPPQLTTPPEVCPELIRKSPEGPAFARDDVGTSFSAPKVTYIASQIEKVLPESPALLYRALIAQSARWPKNINDVSKEECVSTLRHIGYGVPDVERATHNDEYRITLVTPLPMELGDDEAHIFQVPIPEELSNVGEDYDILVEVTLSYAANPRRTRRYVKGYLSTWLDWCCSRIGENAETFARRIFETGAIIDDDGDFNWVLGEAAKAIDLTNMNVELNFSGDTRHKAYAEDAFKYLDRMGDQYDLIILDPPAFAKHKDALRNALRGYTKLNAKAFEKIKPGGILFTFSCSQVVDKVNFRNAVFTAAAQSGRSVRILHQLTQPGDHPVNIYHPEGEYLKGLVLYVE